MTLSESGLPLSPVCLHPDLLPNSGHCMGKDTGNERRLLPLVGRQGVPCLRAASGVQFVIPPLCAPGQSQHQGAVLPGRPTPVARIPHVGQASPSPSTSPGQCREERLGSRIQSWERGHCTSVNLSFFICFMDGGERSLTPPSPVPCVNGHSGHGRCMCVRMIPPFRKLSTGAGDPWAATVRQALGQALPHLLSVSPRGDRGAGPLTSTPEQAGKLRPRWGTGTESIGPGRGAGRPLASPELMSRLWRSSSSLWIRSCSSPCSVS